MKFSGDLGKLVSCWKNKLECLGNKKYGYTMKCNEENIFIVIMKKFPETTH